MVSPKCVEAQINKFRLKLSTKIKNLFLKSEISKYEVALEV